MQHIKLSRLGGFTLIELLVVVLIIGILAGVALPQYQRAVLKSRYTQLMTAGDAVQRAEELYYMANGVYTNNLEDLDIDIPQNGFTLALDVRPDGHAAINAISAEWGLGHIVYFQQHSGADRAGRRECRAYTASATDNQHAVCKSLTNSTSGSVGNGFTAYVFQ
ncbi:type IV pilin protein [Candidatus Avelusimicrobium faecicola]|uniref:type IV pilin protein n=1 Tax=Candidatus Avelusimicrobium faecicola TaxID=3416205 RepID=UPI003D1375E6